MLKELIICIVIVIVIFFGNVMTQNYTKETMEELASNLEDLKTEIVNENKDTNNINNKIDKLNKTWENAHDKLAYFIEHDELEKVETNLVSMKSLIETGQYEESTNELDKNIFVLKHIEDKYSFNLKNIF